MGKIYLSASPQIDLHPVKHKKQTNKKAEPLKQLPNPIKTDKITSFADLA